jgi:hypothetical protein
MNEARCLELKDALQAVEHGGGLIYVGNFGAHTEILVYHICGGGGYLCGPLVGGVVLLRANRKIDDRLSLKVYLRRAI